ncbi:MAG: ATP-binding protein [Alphaproteobacteria bacterium]
MNKINLKQKMALAFSLVLVFSCLILFILSHENFRNSINSEIYNALPNRAENIARIIYEQVEANIKVLNTIAQRDVIKSMDWQKQKPVLTSEAQRTDFMVYGIIKPDGYANSLDSNDIYLGDRKYFAKAMHGQCNMSEMLISRVTNDPVAIIACPIKGNNDKIKGVIYGRLTQKEIVNFIKNITFLANSYAYIIDTKGKLIAHPNPTVLFNNIFDEAKENNRFKSASEFLKNFIKSNKKIGEYLFDGRTIFAGATIIPNTDWIIVVAAPKKDVFANLYKLERNLTIATILIISLGIIISIYASNWIAVPIIGMTSIMNKLAGGDMKVEVPEQDIKDEIGNMARAIETFRQKLLEKEILEIKQKISNRALKANEKRYRMLFSTMLEGFSVHELLYDEEGKPYNYKFLEINPAFEKITELKNKKVIGKTILDVMPDIESSWLQIYSNVVKTGNPIHFEAYSKPLNKYFEVNAFRNAPNQFATIFIDITERKTHEKQIIKAKEWFSHLYNETPIMLFSLNRKSKIISVNKKWLEIMGYSENEIIGKECYKFMPKKSALYAKKITLPDLWEYGSAKNETIEFIKSNGDIITVLLNSVATIDPTGNEICLTSIQDISEIKAAKAREEKVREQLITAQKNLAMVENMSLISQLVAGVAHEINTPIGTALTATSHLNEKTKKFIKSYQNGELKKSILENYIDSTKETTNLIMANIQKAAEQIVSFKQIAVDHSSQERREFNLKEYINEVVDSLRPRIKGTKISLKIKCDEDIVIDSYPGALFQVITNLFINSLIHAFEKKKTGEISISINNIKSEKGNSSNIKIEFSDNGSGISKTKISKIFEPFYTTKRGSGGSGLGLSIVYNIVTQTLCGDIRVSSSKNKGTIFTIIIPKNAQ